MTAGRWTATALLIACLGCATAGLRASRTIPAMQAVARPAPGVVVVRNAWVRESTATRTTSAGYLTIENPTSHEVTLLSVTVQGAKRAELHAVAHEGGQGRMQGVTGIPIPARSSVDLAPGGTHIMLSDVAPPYVRGSTVTMTLMFGNQQTQTARAIVRPLSATSAR